MRCEESSPSDRLILDAILSIDAFPYFGTDDHYLNYLAQFVKPGGIIAIAGAGFVSEFEGDVPDHLAAWFQEEHSLWCLHSSEWWRRHWQRTGILQFELADHMSEGWRLWLEWLKIMAPDNRMEIETIEADAGRNLTYNRVIGRRRVDAIIHSPIVSIPANFVAKPLLRVQPSEQTS